MASPLVTHVIGGVVMVAVIIAVVNYGSIMYNTTRYNNLQQLYEEIASAIAVRINSAVLDAYMRGLNNTIIHLANPVEAAAGEKYNVYIGVGSSLSKLFPRVPGDTGLYVVVSSPDNTIYGYASASMIPGVEVARGRVVINKYRTGFDAAYGYSENGVPFLCRMPINVTERAGVDLSNYLVLVNLSLTGVNCTYLGKQYSPSRSDVRFTDSDGVTPLDYYIEYWGSVNALIWVKIPLLKAREVKTIYMYWGNSFAQEKSNPGIFTLLSRLGEYSGIQSLLLSGVWGVKYNNTASINIAGNSSVLTASATYTASPGYVNIYSIQELDATGKLGWIVEALGSPVDTGSNSQNYRAGFYAWNTTAEKYSILLIPPVIDSSTSLSNYTIIYGNWSITGEATGEGVNLVVNNTALQTIQVGKNTNISIAIAQRSISSTGEYASMLYKVRVDSYSGVYRGIVLSEGLANTSNQAFAIVLTVDDKGYLQVCQLDVDRLLQGQTQLDCESTGVSVDSDGEWFYINATIRNPAQGQGNPELELTVYRASDGSLVYQLPRQGTQGFTGRADYIGPIVYYNGVPVGYTGSEFDDLVAIRYGSPVDLTNIMVVGLPAGWIAELWDGDFNASGVAGSNGVAVLNVTLKPVLGVDGPVYLYIYTGDGVLVDVFEINQVISGGTIIEYAPGIRESTSSFSAMIHASANNICNVNVGKGGYVYLLDTGSTCIGMGVSNIAWGWYWTSVGYFNGSFYYFIENQFNRALYSSYSLASTVKPASLRVVFGVSAEGLSNVKNTNTTGLFQLIMLRPFVYPEPSVSYSSSLIQNASFPQPPTVIVDQYSGYIVFSSDLTVDIVVAIKSTGGVVVVEVPRGVRGH